jgi:cell division protein FtsB
MTGIRELKAKQAAALQAYHAEHARLEEEIRKIRQQRGTKIKQPSYDGYREEGRDRTRWTPWG